MSCIFSSLVEKSWYLKKKNPDTLFILLSISWMFLLSLLWLLSICTCPRYMINIPIDADQSKSNLARVCNNDYKKFQQSSARIKNINGKHIMFITLKNTYIFYSGVSLNTWILSNHLCSTHEILDNYDLWKLFSLSNVADHKKWWPAH